MEQELRKLIEDANEAVRKTNESASRVETALQKIDAAMPLIDAAVANSNSATSKLNKILNTMLIVMGIIFMPAIYAFVDTRDLAMNAVSREEFKESTDKFYETYVNSQDALVVHQLEHDWVRTQLYKITRDEAYKTGGDDQVKKIVEAFFSDPHRGIKAELKKEE